MTADQNLSPPQSPLFSYILSESFESIENYRATIVLIKGFKLNFKSEFSVCICVYQINDVPVLLHDALKTMKTNFVIILNGIQKSNHPPLKIKYLRIIIFC